jgi:Fic family protein
METIKQEVYELFQDIDKRNDSLKEKWVVFANSNKFEEFSRDFLIQFAYNSNKIDGSELTLEDTQAVFEGINIAPVSADEERYLREARGAVRGSEFMKELLRDERKFTQDVIKDIHELVAEDQDERSRGVYRSTPVYINESNMVPVSPVKIRPRMDDLMFWYENEQIHPLEKTVLFHAKFERIHPFLDCNGRAGRLILNYMLMREGYPAIDIKAEDRDVYWSALAKAQVDHDPNDLLMFIAKTLSEEIDRRLDIAS